MFWMVVRRRVIGPGSRDEGEEVGGDTSIWTCILHLISSIGVLDGWVIFWSKMENEDVKQVCAQYETGDGSCTCTC